MSTSNVQQLRKMTGTLKSFDNDEHFVYDEQGKNAILHFLNNKLKKYNLQTIENTNQYGIDLLTFNSLNKVIHCWEIEVRYGNWQGDIPFPFKEINCIERKDYQWRKEQEFIDKIPFPLSSDFKVTYVQLNKECTRAVLIDSDIILKYPLKQWNNRKATGEYVRQVPISETIQIKLKTPNVS